MNLTELARKLKVPPKTLLENLPKLGFDIGKKAIKVDDRIAHKILRSYSESMRQLEAKQKEERKQQELEDALSAAGKEIQISEFVTVRDLSAALHISVPLLMTELMKNGILSSVNERLDFETASIVAEDLGFTVVKKDEADNESHVAESAADRLTDALKKSTLLDRPPVVVVMGHVDHGKTTLLDAVRKTDVVAGEAGGITQHIGAYQVTHDDKPITFIDTPGHEAFRAMRSRGARVADVAILIVAADDGWKPQTEEALSIIKGAEIPFIVAINKIDKPEANIERVKKELAEKNLLPEDWGGKTICVPISAKAGENLEQLLEMVLLVADLHKDEIKADPTARAMGSVIESHVDPKEGPVATVLVRTGTLRAGDALVSGDMNMGKARVLKDHHGETVTIAEPATPVRILGFKDAPEVGDLIEAGDPEKTYDTAKKRKMKRSSDDITKVTMSDEEDSDQASIPVFIKADVLGSLEAILESVAKLEHPEVRVQIIGKGLGNVSDGDVQRAGATKDTLMAAFHVQVTRAAKELAEEQGVEIKTYEVIYDLISDLKARLSAKLSPEVVRTKLGDAKVLAVFKTTSKLQVVGARVTDGLIKSGSEAVIFRNKEEVARGLLTRLQAGREEIKEISTGAEAGFQIEGVTGIAAGDKIEFYVETKQQRAI